MHWIIAVAWLAVGVWAIRAGTKRPDRTGDRLQDYYDRVERGER